MCVSTEVQHKFVGWRCVEGEEDVFRVAAIAPQSQKKKRKLNGGGPSCCCLVLGVDLWMSEGFFWGRVEVEVLGARSWRFS